MRSNEPEYPKHSFLVGDWVELHRDRFLTDASNEAESGKVVRVIGVDARMVYFEWIRIDLGASVNRWHHKYVTHATQEQIAKAKGHAAYALD